MNFGRAGIRRWALALVAVFASSWPPSVGAEATLSPALAAHLGAGRGGTVRVWVMFRDRGALVPGVEAALEYQPSQRARDRRSRRSPGRPAFDVHDLPVFSPYLRSVADTGCRVRYASRYLNAVSVVATPRQIETIRRLDGVSRIARVGRYSRPASKERPLRARQRDAPRTSPSIDYGPSLRQVDQIDVIPLHAAGYHGEGILVALLDTGFNRAHDALDHLNVVAEWDFIFDDSVTSDEPEDPRFPSQQSHGTHTLSVVAGYAPGRLIGPAWAADVVLAKTERRYEEVQGEEDDFVRALEWADSIGADVVSASLGYFDWYDYSDMDGNTAVTTRACDIAASRGIVVVASVGNQGGGVLGWPGVIAPADGDSVIAVGAVDSSGVVVSFSSRGPTFDGRIKPDFMAMGFDDVAASAFDSLSYVRVDGTSFAAPLVAGACALLLQMHPSWGPGELVNALRNDASNAATPNNAYGWGVIDAYQTGVNAATGNLSAVTVSARLDGNAVTVTVALVASGGVTVDVERRFRASASGWEPLQVVAADIALEVGQPRVVVDDALSPGVYEYRARSVDDPSQVSSWRRVTVPFALVLRQSAPNPFDLAAVPATTIDFTIGGSPLGSPSAPVPGDRVALSIYNVRGQLIRNVFTRALGPGDYTAEWDGRNTNGERVSSGVYFYRLGVGGRSMTRKIVVVGP